MECIFCKIVENQIPAKKILETERFLAFHDINPQAPIHVLVIPKQHVSDFNHLEPELMAEATEFIQRVVRELDMAEAGYRIINNCGSHGGQEVFHIHFHILGGARLKWERLA